MWFAGCSKKTGAIARATTTRTSAGPTAKCASRVASERRSVSEFVQSNECEGIRIAVRWIRELPRFTLIHESVRIGWNQTRPVVESIARKLEARLATSEEDTPVGRPAVNTPEGLSDPTVKLP